MGGRGARSGGGAGGAFGVAGGGNMANPVLSAVPPNVQLGQPAPAVTSAQLQAMSGDEFATYLTALRTTPINPNIYYNHSWETQRLIANMPDLNQAPTMVDAKTFASLPGEALYRTVNEKMLSGGTHSNWDQQTALDICARTMTSDVSTIGAGRFGDGFYFATSKSESQMYGTYRNNVNRTATMQAKLNGNAKVISSTSLKHMFNGESQRVRNAVNTMSATSEWSGSGLMAYALWKGYNVVREGSYLNIIDRNAATWNSHVEAKK